MEMDFGTVVVPLGRNARFGHFDVSTAGFTQTVHEHIYKYGLRQILNDAMADKTDDDGNALSDEAIVAKAQKRLDTLYSGELRTHRASSEPVDPVEREAFRLARQKIEMLLRNEKLWPVKGRDKFDTAVAARCAAIGREMTTEEYIVAWLERNPKVRAEAKRNVAANEKLMADAGEMV
jgi:hypothetical protein